MPLIAVVGATGAQGGAVVDALLRKGYSVRGLTRKPDSEKGTALRNKGVEVVAADLDDKASLVAAFTGADGVFVVTNFWEIFDVDREVQQGKNQFDAARDAGVRHIVFSTLEGVTKVVGDGLNKIHGYCCAHFDSKDLITDYAKTTGLNVTYLYTSFYYENFLSYFPPRKGADGKYHLSINMGNKAMPSVAVKDIGNVAANAFEAGPAVYGRNVYAVGDKLTFHEYAAAFSRVFNTEVVYDELTTEQFAGLGFPGADEMANMFAFKRDYEEHFPRDVVAAREFTPEHQSFEDWLLENKNRFDLP